MNVIKRVSLRLTVIVLLFSLSAVSCKDEFNSSVPYRHVDFMVNLGVYNELTIPGNSMVNPAAGVGGVIIFHSYDEIYYALDAACPCEIADSVVSVEVDGSGIATCPVCGTTYELWGGGGVLSAGCPDAEPLKGYNATKSGTTLYITN